MDEKTVNRLRKNLKKVAKLMDDAQVRLSHEEILDLCTQAQDSDVGEKT